jgi:hypothetical protein
MGIPVLAGCGLLIMAALLFGEIVAGVIVLALGLFFGVRWIGNVALQPIRTRRQRASTGD